MKGFFVAVVVILLGISMNAQQLREDYLRKSKTQKTFAWILAGGGAAMAIGGLTLMAAQPDFVDYETIGLALVGGGAAAITGGVLLFSSAKKNERKANAMTIQLHLKIENAKTYREPRRINNYYPALAFNVGLR